MNIRREVLEWLLQGDPAVRWQTMRDLADGREVFSERQKVSSEGWGAKLLSCQDSSGSWCGGLYSPKWISTTYTMLLLRRLGLVPENVLVVESCKLLLERGFYRDSGINYSSSIKYSETCITGMILSILAYFRFQDERIAMLVQHLLDRQMKDGGWNCQSYKGATHSSFHTTINVLEGLREYQKRSSIDDHIIAVSQKRAHEFLLAHRLFRYRKNKTEKRRTLDTAEPASRQNLL